ncbi:MAG: helix-turn-helix domain-containing protein [Deltaproteobacteria bacterium]|nr:MAG: helix-turn-helix domain-containing protein [Deltaproteobacteria bacterium]
MQLSVADVATLLSVSEKTVYRWIQQGRLPAYRLGQQFRFNKSELLEWATAQRVPLSPELFVAPEAEPVPSLTESLRAGGVLYRVGGEDKRAVLRAAVDALRLGDDVDRDVLLAVLLARESLGSTGIGDGIAIPHVRNPIVLHVTKPTVTLCFLEQPVDFDAIDGRPVHALFIVTTPTIQSHLHTLSRLAWVLRDPEVREALADPPVRARVYELFAAAEARLGAQGSAT